MVLILNFFLLPLRRTPVSFSQSVKFESVCLLANQNPNEEGRSESRYGR